MVGKMLTLSDGYEIPVVGLGTWNPLGPSLKQAVKDAIHAGYRHFDCALLYLNEEEIGEAIREKITEGVVKREDLYITSKCWNNCHSKERVVASCQKSLELLKLDYVDLYLIHWPMGFQETENILEDFETQISGPTYPYSNVDYVETWKGMEECRNKGLARSIGLSNFNSVQLIRVCNEGTIKPVVNQVECHPYLNQSELLKLCNSYDIKLVAYCPLVAPFRVKMEEPHILEHDSIKAIGSKHNKTPAQVILRWQLQRGIIVIPKSATKERIIGNIQIFDFELTEEEMDVVNSFNRGFRTCGFDWAKDHLHYPFNIPY